MTVGHLDKDKLDNALLLMMMMTPVCVMFMSVITLVASSAVLLVELVGSIICLPVC